MVQFKYEAVINERQTLQRRENDGAPSFGKWKK